MSEADKRAMGARRAAFIRFHFLDVSTRSLSPLGFRLPISRDGLLFPLKKKKKKKVGLQIVMLLHSRVICFFCLVFLGELLLYPAVCFTAVYVHVCLQ